MEPEQLVWAALGLFLAGMVKGTTGIGYATCGLPFLVSSFGLTAGMAIILAPAMATNVSLAVTGGNLLACLQQFRALYAIIPLGIAAGLGLLQWIEQPTAVRLLGGIMLAYGALALAGARFSTTAVVGRRLLVPIGFAHGVMTGLTGAQVIPLVPFMLSLDIKPATAVQAINIAVLLSCAIMAVGLAATGIVSTNLLWLSMAAVPPALAGVGLGARIRNRLPERYFRASVLTAVAVSGAALLVR